MELMKLNNRDFLNSISFCVGFICLVSSCVSHVTLSALSIGMSFSAKLSIFGDFSVVKFFEKTYFQWPFGGFKSLP